MAWFRKKTALTASTEKKNVQVPEGVWTKCKNCQEIIYAKEVQRNLNVCPKCDYHFRIGARERIGLVIDEGTFVEMDAKMRSVDFLDFKDSKKYKDRIKAAVKKMGDGDAVICGEGNLDGLPVVVAVFDFAFMGGSMGSVVGEKITRAIEKGLDTNAPVLIFSSSGGARMQESIMSLMQMAKTSAALAKLKAAGVPFISVLTDPTTGGVTASFAMLGDLNIAEPRALIGFAGPRVIEQTIRQTLPEGFQRSEYLLEHGMIDMIIPRKEMKQKLSQLLRIFTKKISKMADYQDSLAYLYSLQFFGIKLGLENIRRLLSKVGNPQQHLRIIHIAGTNGKGSTAAALAGIFKAAGISAGLYTSPHLHSFTERIRINTHQISESDARDLIEEFRPHAEALQATFFEFTTAMALLCFQRRGVQWAILETGLGGRLDATNIVTPELCLLTPIALDHTAYLGTELTEVAAEKAGIFKTGVPVISGYQEAEVRSILQQRATDLQLSLLEFGKDYHWHGEGDLFTVSGGSFLLDGVEFTQAGEYQRQNFALAAVAMDYLSQKGLEIGTAEIQEGLEMACWPGRLEWLPQQILLDGAHNPAGAKNLAVYLQQQNIYGLHLIVGCKADKQASELISELLPFARCVYVTQPPVDAAVPVAEIVQQVRETGKVVEGYPEPVAALQAAMGNRSSEEIILVAGSLFLVAEIRAFLLGEVDSLAITRSPAIL